MVGYELKLVLHGESRVPLGFRNFLLTAVRVVYGVRSTKDHITMDSRVTDMVHHQQGSSMMKSQSFLDFFAKKKKHLIFFMNVITSPPLSYYLYAAYYSRPFGRWPTDLPQKENRVYSHHHYRESPHHYISTLHIGGGGFGPSQPLNLREAWAAGDTQVPPMSRTQAAELNSVNS